MLTADEIVRLLDLKPHPEGGHYRETFRDAATVGLGADPARAASTAIYFLLARRRGVALAQGRRRRGLALVCGRAAGLDAWRTRSGRRGFRLGADLAAGERPQAVVPAGAWQQAASLGDWTLVGCTVAPGFQFAGFEMAPPGFEPA